MMVSVFKYILAPKLYKQYGVGSCQVLYEPNSLEKWGDQILSTLSLMWNIGYYTSPIILTFLVRRGYFAVESMLSLVKFAAGIGVLLMISLCMRGIGRSKSDSYVNFMKVFNKYGSMPCAETRRALALFDFDFRSWPIDFEISQARNSKTIFQKLSRMKFLLKSALPCQVAAYFAVQTFGIRMIYPGCVKLIQVFIEPVLIQGRCKLIEQEKAVRYKLKTCDLNEIDAVFIDNRNKNDNGKILVICSEGNAGFYEIGIMSTPLSKKYSVVGWNHPGFAGSTGLPFPAQDENAIDSVMQFALNYLGFPLENIILFGWSIGAYSTLWAAKNYPDIRGIILDATFDDILYLALPKMPNMFSGVVELAIREYVNLNNSELVKQYSGPILMIRRTEDEIICTHESNINTNRGNYLLLNMLRYRFPNIFKLSQMELASKILSKPLDKLSENREDQECFSLLASYVSVNKNCYPLPIGETFNEIQRNNLVEFLIRKHLRDFKSTHCTPLPAEFFDLPWNISVETDFIPT